MPSELEETAKVQLTGVLSKRPVNPTNQGGGILASKWYRRFFVIKDGFLMYYPESEKREFERKKCANYHPKGLMPLGDCYISRMSELDTPHMISIVNELSQERLVIQCESLWEQEEWIEALEKGARICWKNAQLGDTLIQQLQLQGAKLAEERQDAYTKLHDEAQALSEEKSKTEEMEKLMLAMEEEKKKLKLIAENIQEELESVSKELEETTLEMRKVELEREKLVAQQAQLSTNLITLEEQRKSTEQQLEESQNKTVHLETQNLELSSQSEQARAELAEQIKAEQRIKSNLEENLKLIEVKMNQVMSDKEEAEKKAQVQAELADKLNEEKTMFHEEAKELEKNLNDIKQQKDMTEAELKEEIKARLRAEERLKEAESALHNLEQRINEVQTVASDEKRNQLLLNVKALKRYFEGRAVEEKVAADKPIIMRRAVYNKRRNIRAQTVYIRQDEDKNTTVSESTAASLVEVRKSSRASKNRPSSHFVPSEKTVEKMAVKTDSVECV